jgi:hypothetical protein
MFTEADVRLGIFLFHPTIPNYPKAKFPGVVVFSEIYQGRLLSSSSSKVIRHAKLGVIQSNLLQFHVAFDPSSSVSLLLSPYLTHTPMKIRQLTRTLLLLFTQVLYTCLLFLQSLDLLLASLDK